MNSRIASTATLLFVFVSAGLSGQAQGKNWKSDSGGTKTWGNGNSWKDELDPETTGVPDDGDTATVEAGLLEIGNLRGLGYLKMIGGNLRGVSGADFDTLELRGNSAHSEWFNGSIRQLRLLIASGAFLDGANTINNDFTGSLIENNGTFTWTSGNLTTDATGGITNNVGALFADANSSDVSISSSGATFDNYGTYRKSGAGTTNISQTFNNFSSKTLEVSAGIFEIAGGGTNIDGAVMRVTDSGLIVFKSNPYTIVNAANLEVGSIENENALDGSQFFTLPSGEQINFGFELAGSTLTLGSVEGSALDVAILQSGGTLAGTQVIASDYYLDAGDLNSNGATTIANGGSLTLAHTGQNDFNNRTIENLSGGIVNWTDGDLRSGSGGLFNNFGTFNDSAAPSGITEVVNNAFGGTALIFTNESTGTYNKTSAGETRFDVKFDNNGTVNIDAGTLQFTANNSHSATATITVATGALVQLGANTALVSGVEITGGGTIKQTSSTLSGAAQFDTVFQQTGGTLDGDFKFSNRFDMTGGSIAAGSTLDLNGTANSTLDVTSLSLDNTTLKIGADSTLNWSRGSINTGNNGGLNINGLLTTDFDGTMNQNLTGSGYLDVAGSFRKTGGSGATTFDLPVNVSGRFEAHTGTIRLTGGGTSDGGLFDIWSDATLDIDNGYNFNDGTTVPNGGNLNLNSGTFTLDQSVHLGQHAYVSGGVITGTHTLGGKVTIDGGTFDSGGTTTIAESSSIQFANIEDNPLNRSFINNGKILWSEGDMTGSGENSLTNNGEFAVSVDGTFGAPAGGYSIQNNGDFIKTSGTGTTTIDVPFTNNGTIGAATGQFRFTDTLTFGSNATLGGGVQFDAPVALPSSSTLAGNGTIMGSITTGGTVSPGNSIGSLSITGDLTLLSSSNSFFEVSASTDPISSDFVSVSGMVGLPKLVHLNS